MAFDAMFEEDAEFTIESSGARGTLKCCVFPKEEVDPFVESDNVSMIKMSNALVRKRDWTFQKKPSVGDKFKLPNGDKYKIYSIEDEQDWWKLTGRSF